MLIIKDGDFPAHGESHHSQHYVGHTHFWERAMMSRRKFIGAAAGTTGAILGSGLWMPQLALAAGSAPKPIPGGIVVGGQLFHVFLLGEGNEPSTITDFNGFVGLNRIRGVGAGTGLASPTFQADMGFMVGEYVAVDGKHYNTSFGFI